jgi:RimJ/RimL family protein N-acetyltransferase
MRGEIIWNKGAGAGVSMAWGSWQSAANPVLRDVHEYILVFSKGSFRRKKPENKENTISREQFMEWTKSVWTMNPESARKVGHPAPFPIELPYRLIQLYTFRGDVILDPFMGSGSTAIAAVKAQRKYIGYENNPKYVKLAEERIVAFGSQLSDVEIRPWSEGDLALEERLLGDPAMTVHLGGPETAEQIRKRHARYLTTGDSGQGRMFAIVVGPGRVAAGSVGYWEREWRGQHIWEAGWSVLPEFQGQGVATRATAALVEQARAAGKHRFLHAFPSVENGPSNAICRKAGFTLQEEVEFEYPPGNLMRCNDWRLDLLADRAEQSHEPLRLDPQ